MKKKIIAFICISCIVFSFTACKDKDNGQDGTPDALVTQDKGNGVNENEDNNDEQTVSVSDEIAKVEAAYQEILSRDTTNYTQVEFNTDCYEQYQLWDNELNALWGQIKSTLDEGSYDSLLEEQRAWLDRKMYHVRAAGAQAFGGSMQPMLESSGAADITRVRCYQLAKVLADARGEQFSMEEVEAVVDYIDPSYDDVMWGFRGPYDMVSFDESTGSLMISHESDEWEAIIIYNGENQQVELWGYDSDHVIWKSTDGEFFELGLSWENELQFAHRDDLVEYVDSY